MDIYQRGIKSLALVCLLKFTIIISYCLKTAFFFNYFCDLKSKAYGFIESITVGLVLILYVKMLD